MVNVGIKTKYLKLFCWRGW